MNEIIFETFSGQKNIYVFDDLYSLVIHDALGSIYHITIKDYYSKYYLSSKYYTYNERVDYSFFLCKLDISWGGNYSFNRYLLGDWKTGKEPVMIYDKKFDKYKYF